MAYANRVAAILEITRQLKPDVVCFQEVLPTFVNAVQAQPWAKEYAVHSDRDGSTVRPYGVLTLARSPNANVTFHDFPSGMGRKLLAVQIADEGQVPWIVGNVHLESLNNPGLRKDQLSISSKVLSAHSGNAVLVGDFNFCSYHSWAENRKLGQEGRLDSSPLENEVLQAVLPAFSDVWPQLRPDERGYTFDSEKNRVIRQYEQMRYDRVLARMTGGWRPTSIQLVGTEALRDEGGSGEHFEGGRTFPSDHFGLLCTFEAPKA